MKALATRKEVKTIKWVCTMGHQHNTRDVATRCSLRHRFGCNQGHAHQSQERMEECNRAAAAGMTRAAAAREKRKLWLESRTADPTVKRVQDGPFEGLPLRVMRFLELDLIKTPEDLIQRTQAELLRIPGLCRLALWDLHEWLQGKGMLPSTWRFFVP
jgi:hypothetical protein